jgi:hypothetical protein
LKVVFDMLIVRCLVEIAEPVYRSRYRHGPDSVSAYKKVLLLAPNNIFALLGLTATYSLMGREKEARAQAKEVLKLNPKFSIDYFVRVLPYKDQSLSEKYYFNPLRKAGLK